MIEFPEGATLKPFVVEQRDRPSYCSTLAVTDVGGHRGIARVHPHMEFHRAKGIS
jgi:hypothetical protein